MELKLKNINWSLYLHVLYDDAPLWYLQYAVGIIMLHSCMENGKWEDTYLYLNFYRCDCQPTRTWNGTGNILISERFPIQPFSPKLREIIRTHATDLIVDWI